MSALGAALGGPHPLTYASERHAALACASLRGRRRDAPLARDAFRHDPAATVIEGGRGDGGAP